MFCGQLILRVAFGSGLELLELLTCSVVVLQQLLSAVCLNRYQYSAQTAVSQTLSQH